MKKKTPNFSKSHEKYIKKIKKDKIFVIFFRIFVLIAFLGLWELLTHFKILDPFFVSSPSRIFKQIFLLAQNGTLISHSLITLYETLLGFFIATFLGYVIAILLWWNEKVRKIFEPYIVVLNSLPKIALGAWAWGNDGTLGRSLTPDSLRPIFDKAMENGLNLWDTAYAYGMGTSEKVLADFVKDLPRELSDLRQLCRT